MTGSTKRRFQYLCNECEEPLVYIDNYKVCPRGHGKLIPTTAEERRGPEYKKRRINPADLSGFSIPPETVNKASEAKS